MNLCIVFSCWIDLFLLLIDFESDVLFEWLKRLYSLRFIISNLVVNEYINILNNAFTQILYMYNQIDKFISRSSYYADWPYSADPCHGWIHTVLHHPYDVPDKRNAALWLARVSLPKNVQVSSAEHCSITCTGTHVPVVYWLLLFVSSEFILRYMYYPNKKISWIWLND